MTIPAYVLASLTEPSVAALCILMAAFLRSQQYALGEVFRLLYAGCITNESVDRRALRPVSLER